MKIIYFYIACAMLSIFFILKLMVHGHNFHKLETFQPTIEIVLAKAVNMPVFISSSGVAQSMHHVDIASDISGKVEKIFFKSGQFVHAGDLLVELDHQLISDQLQEETYKESYLDKNFQRYADLAKRGIIAKDNLDHLQSDLLQEKSKVHELQAELGKRFIRVPFSGRLGLREINLGQYVQAGDKIVNLQQSKKIIIDLNISCEQMKNIRVGQNIKIDSLDMVGKVVAIDPGIDLHSRSVMTRVLVDNSQEKIIPGSYLTASICISQHQQVVMLPQSAIFYDEKGESIFVVSNGKIYEKSVVSEIYNKSVIVRNGVSRGEMVVVSAQDRLFDGEKMDGQFRLKDVTNEPT